MRLAMKTATYGVLHVSVATVITYLLTGNVTAAIGIGLIEPLVQTGVFALHERIWESVPNRESDRTPLSPPNSHALAG